ncbi:MAG: hypothetical protein AB1673_13970 [Actinomycetota bacterium]|jgi:hypothetical protein
MDTCVLEHPRADHGTEASRPVTAGPARSRKLLVGAVISVLGPIAVTGVAWANGCACG